jgi:ubiquitin-protein ligase
MRLEIPGPRATPYEDAKFHMRVRYCTGSGSFCPPEAHFDTPIAHPCIGTDGTVMDIGLALGAWSPADSLLTSLYRLHMLLRDPPADRTHPLALIRNWSAESQSRARAITLTCAPLAIAQPSCDLQRVPLGCWRFFPRPFRNTVLAVLMLGARQWRAPVPPPVQEGSQELRLVRLPGKRRAALMAVDLPPPPAPPPVAPPPRVGLHSIPRAILFSVLQWLVPLPGSPDGPTTYAMS